MRPFQTIQSLKVLQKSRSYQKICQSTSRFLPLQRMENLTTNDKSLHFEGSSATDGAIQWIEEHFHLAENNASFRYYYNATVSLETVEPLLNDIQSNISAKMDPNVDLLPGINESMFYLRHPNNFTGIHVKDSCLESLNILRSGSPKIWIIVDRTSYSRFNDSLSEDLYRIPSYGKPVACSTQRYCGIPAMAG